MIDMASITIWRSHPSGVSYGDPVDHEDVPSRVLDAIEGEIIEKDEDEGAIEVGGQWWAYRRGS